MNGPRRIKSFPYRIPNPMISVAFRNSSYTFAWLACVAMCLTTFQPGCKGRGRAMQGMAPQWELKSVDGRTMKLSDFDGKVVILDFWATWCGPCRLEIPGFVELQKEFGDKGLAVIGVSLDEQGPPVVRKFMENFNVNYPMVMADDKVVQDYGGIRAIPTTFIIDRKGKLIRKHVGYASKEEFEKEIKALL